MSLFCFLVVPLFIMFRHSIASGRGGRGGLLLAFVLGLLAAFLRQLIGDLVPAGLFGFLRWLHLFADRVALPALLPLGVWVLLRKFRGAAFDASSEDFALVWLIPVAALRAIVWSAEGNPAELVLAPLLWIAIAVGVPPFVAAIEREYGVRAFGVGSLAALVPILGTTAAWAFFAHYTIVGFLAFAACIAPAAWAIFWAFKSAQEAVTPVTSVPDEREGQESSGNRI